MLLGIVGDSKGQLHRVSGPSDGGGIKVYEVLGDGVLYHNRVIVDQEAIEMENDQFIFPLGTLRGGGQSSTQITVKPNTHLEPAGVIISSGIGSAGLQEICTPVVVLIQAIADTPIVFQNSCVCVMGPVGRGDTVNVPLDRHCGYRAMRCTPSSAKFMIQ